MNQMNMHGSIPANQNSVVAPNMGMHISQQSPMMQQQPGSMIQPQQSPMMQAQQGPGPMMQQQPGPGPMMQQQPVPGSMMQQQPGPGPMMQQQPGPGPMMQQQPGPGPMMQQQPGPGPMMQQQPGPSPMMQQQPGSIMQQQASTMMQQQPGTMMQQQSPQQMQPGQGPGAGPNNMPQQLPPDKMDNISKVKTLMGCIRDSIAVTLKAAAQVLQQNYTTDATSQKDVADPTAPRFDKNLEEFYALCDQMELHLKTAVTCIQQAHSAGYYLPLSVIPSRLDVNTQETTLSYPSFLSTVRLQISYAKDIHDTLVAAAQNLAPAE